MGILFQDKATPDLESTSDEVSSNQSLQLYQNDILGTEEFISGKSDTFLGPEISFFASKSLVVFIALCRFHLSKMLKIHGFYSLLGD